MADLYADIPELSAEAQANARRRKIAEAMMQQGQAPLESMGMAGGAPIPISWTQGLAKLAQAYVGGKQVEDVETADKSLAERHTGMQTSETQRIADVISGRPETQAPFQADNPFGEDLGTNTTVTPAVAPGGRDAVQAALLESKMPGFRDAGLKMMLSAKTTPEGFTLGPGQARYDASGKLTVQGPAKEVTGKLGTEDVHIGGGSWQSFKVGKDGEVDINSPIGKPFSKRPTASQITTNATTVIPKADTKYAEERMKERAGAMAALDKSAESAAKSNQALDRFLEASKTGTQGGAQPIISATQNFLASFGYNPDDLKDVRQMEQAIGDILGSKMAELGARGLTDRDMDVLRQALPRVNTDRASRENVVGILKKINESVIGEWENQRQEESRIYPDLATRLPEPAWYKARKNVPAGSVPATGDRRAPATAAAVQTATGANGQKLYLRNGQWVPK